MTRRPTPRLLIVDDEERLLHAIARLLRGHCEVELAASANAALERLPRAQVLIADMDMPTITGNELLAISRERCPDVLRVLTSATQPTALAAWCETGLVQAWLPKPAALEDILRLTGHQSASISAASSGKQAR